MKIATAHSSFQKHLSYTRVHLFINDTIQNYSLLRHEERWLSFRKSLECARNLNFSLLQLEMSCPRVIVSAVATLESKFLVQNKDREKESNALPSTAESEAETVGTSSSSKDTEEVSEREKLRRLRISEANKGNQPWNKGRKHSLETLRRIKERTRLAMRSPQVRKKLAKMGHVQSTETRIKIAAGVRSGWQKRHERLKLQETCLFDWQNLIAEASRVGFQDQEELRWDSYNTLSKQLQQEWLDSIEQRKSTPRVKGSKRAPKSLEQRRKISESIAAKWADPAYRTRVCSGLAKYHGIPEGAERKVRKKPSGEESTTFRKKSDTERLVANNVKRRNQLPKGKKRIVPKYKDPLAKIKLEMLKSIRAQRVASETMKIQALERAKLLIVEAQKAAKALDVAAMRSPVARSSLIEVQKLIAEANQSIESTENGELNLQDDGRSVHHGYDENSVTNHIEDEFYQRYPILVNGVKETITTNVNQRYPKCMNGVESESLQFGEGRNLNTDFYKLTSFDDMDHNHRLFEENLDMNEYMAKQYPDHNASLRLNGVSSINGVKFQSQKEDKYPIAKIVTKKWVRGRLVEVVEGESQN